MRISADCIDEEIDNNKDQQLSQQFSRMALNDNKTAEDIRVIYKVNYSSLDSSVSLSVIPVTDHYRNGYQSNWNEVKQQVLDLSFKDKTKVSKNLQFLGRIESAGYELELTNQDEYYTALKVAELCGQPLDVMIKKAVETNSFEANSSPSTPSTARVSAPNHKTVVSKQSSSESDNDPTDERTEFILVDNTHNKNNETPNKADSSTQSTLGDKMVVINESQIEKIKKEITIDVTKRLISKLNECLIDLTNDSTCVPPSAPIQNTSNESADESKTQTKTAPLPKVVHRGIICDNCDLQIEGIRYKCVNCFDFDLCENCKKMPSVHDPTHTFNTIERYIRGIPKQTYAPNLDFLKPFLSGATVDPKSRDMFLTLDVDLNNGIISKSNVSQNNNSTKSQNNTDSGADEQNASKADTLEEETNTSSQSHQRKYLSERKANKITKKLEKLKLKSQMYNNILQTNEERCSPSLHDRPRTQPSAPYLSPAINSNKTLYLSGLIVGDETIPEGTRMPPNTKFRKTWKVRNTGTKVWTGRTTLRFVWGHSELEPFGRVTEVQAPTLRPGEEGKVTIRFTSPNPSTVTRYQSYWRLHHRGQPFGQRLVVKIIVDPMATTITPTPTPLAPILAKDSRNTTLPLTGSVRLPRSQYFVPPSVVGNTYSINGTNCNLEAMAHIHHSILESQRTLSDRLKAMASVKQSLNQNKEKIPKGEKTSAKKLTEALSQVKEIRFNLDENESIPMKSNVKSHTTTPANTPFDVSPPKSPEPNSVANNFSQIQSNEKNDKNHKIEDKLIEEKDNESDCESLDVLSLSSGNESSDEFVLVPFPSCFDLNVPFVGVDNKGFEDSTHETSAQNKEKDNCFEVIDDKNTINEETIESDDSNTESADNNTDQTLTGNEPTDETPLDLTKDRQNEGISAQSLQTESSNQIPEESEAEAQVRPKNINASTNPFRNNSNDTENVIHVLPESIVTGALSAAAHVYNNVSRALFSRNEGNNFAWVTSPPPAALPLPDLYWDNRTNQYRQEMPPQPQTAYYVPPNVGPTAPVYTDMSSPKAEAPTRLTSSLKQLYEMGFWNQKLNQELLEKNDFDVNDTIEELLSPSKRRDQTNANRAQPEEPIVSHQPRNNNNFIDEFD